MRADERSVELRDLGRCAYEPALALQRQLHEQVRRGDRTAVLLLLEHDPVVTLGRRGDRRGILQPEMLARRGIEVVQSERGGDVTYHGPGQLIAYPILRLRDFGLDVRSYVLALEGVVLRLLGEYGIGGRRDAEMHGVFTASGKIASVGVHVSRGVTRHGIALNVDPDAEHWRCIAPCGQAGVVAASLRPELQAITMEGAPPGSMGIDDVAMDDVKARFLRTFAAEFGARVEVQPASS